MASSLSHDRLGAITEAQIQIAAADLDAHELMALVAARARALTGADVAAVERSDGAERIYHSGGDVVASSCGDVRSRLSALLVRRGEVMLCADARSDPRLDHEAVARAGVVSIASVPLRHRARVLGSLGVYSASARAFDDQDVEVLQLLSGLLAAHLAEWKQLEHRGTESAKDALTGLANRRAFEERLGTEVARIRRHGGRLAVCLVDIDEFHEVNDTLGRAVGDEVLRGVARNLADVRGEDEAFRIAGDDFAVIFCEVDVAGARVAARRLAAAVEDDRGCGGVTISWGVAELEGGDPAALMANAQEALNDAKRASSI